MTTFPQDVGPRSSLAKPHHIIVYAPSSCVFPLLTNNLPIDYLKLEVIESNLTQDQILSSIFVWYSI